MEQDDFQKYIRLQVPGSCWFRRSLSGSSPKYTTEEDIFSAAVRTGVYACVPGRVYGRHDPSRDAQADGAGGG